MKNPILSIVIFSLLNLLIVSCSNQAGDGMFSSKDKELQALQVNHAVSPPNQTWDIPFEEHQLQADEAKTIQTTDGSIISIPAGTLVDANGQAVKGEAEIRYREFKSASDIFRSGIPMQYDSAGSSHILRSAGMFEMRASQGDKPLFIADGKQIEVQMSSSKSGSYNFYKLDEEGGNNWQFITSATAIANELPSDSIFGGFDGNPEGSLKPEKANKNATIFDFKTNYEVYPELAKYKDILWQDADKASEGVLNIEKNDWIFGEVWIEAKVKRAFREGTGFYYLDIQNNAKKARLLVKPVLEGNAYVEALKTYRQDKAEQERLQKLYAQQARENVVLQAQQTALGNVNSFYTGISSFGFYNWDLIVKKGELEVLAVDFQFENGNRPEEVYLIIPEAPVAVKFNQKTWANFTFSKHWECMVITIMPDKTLAVIDDEALKTKLTAGGENVLTFQQGVRVQFPKEIAAMLAP